MVRSRTVLVLSSMLAVAATASASEEEFVVWQQVKIVSPAYKETGTVVFDAQTDGETSRAVSIRAFDKDFKLDDAQLSKLKGFPLSSLSITHEAGYERLGGHTVHFKMKRVFYQAPKTREEHIRISISKGKGLEIFGPEAK
jgi:hypothetical protein